MVVTIRGLLLNKLSYTIVVS